MPGCGLNFEYIPVMVSVIIPALNEASTIGNVIRRIKRSELELEIIVVDDNSDDNTLQVAQKEGVRVITSLRRGKGVSMREGLLAASFDVIVYLDADILTYPKNVVDLLTKDILAGEADFVKATFDRQGGRVTQLVAKPLLSIFFPELEHFAQPLSGMIAARKSFLEQVTFENDYGVDIGLLIDAVRANQRVKEVNIGFVRNDMQSLESLGKMSRQVSSAILRKAESLPSRNLETLANIHVISDEMDTAITESLQKLKKMLIVDISVVMQYNYNQVVSHLYHSPAIQTYTTGGALGSLQPVAGILKGKSLPELQSIADDIPLTAHVRETVKKFKSNGYSCVLLSDGFDVIANHIKNKTGFDFVFAHRLILDKGIATGEVEIPEYFKSTGGGDGEYGKQNVLSYITSRTGIPSKNMIYVGRDTTDIPLLQDAGMGIVPEDAQGDIKIFADRTIPAGTLKPLQKLVPHPFHRPSVKFAAGAGLGLAIAATGYYLYTRRKQKKPYPNRPRL